MGSRMISQFRSTDPRLLGAALALALDLAMVAVAALLVNMSWSLAFGLLPAGAFGLVVAPVFGWRYARPAGAGRGRAWMKDAVRSLALAGAGIITALVFIQAVTVPVEGGIEGRIALVLYAIIMDTIAVGVLTFVSALLLGFPWTRIMRSLGSSFRKG